MRIIKWRDKTTEKFNKARELIHQASIQKIEGYEEMEKSWHKSWETLNCMLHNFPLPKDEFGYVKEGYEYVLEITPDFVEASFGFVFFYKEPEQDYKKNFNGGLILHGFEETFSVSLENKSHPYWAIHT